MISVMNFGFKESFTQSASCDFIRSYRIRLFQKKTYSNIEMLTREALFFNSIAIC